MPHRPLITGLALSLLLLGPPGAPAQDFYQEKIIRFIVGQAAVAVTTPTLALSRTISSSIFLAIRQ
jgi:hypothetical protein